MKIKYTCPGCKRRDELTREPKINIQNLSKDKKFEIMKHILLHMVEQGQFNEEKLGVEIVVDTSDVFDFICAHYDIETVLSWMIEFSLTEVSKLLTKRDDILKMVNEHRAIHKREHQI
jgi:hypothetical protein